MHSLISDLPLGSYKIGDAAYTVSDQVLILFTGSDCLDPSNDAFNYFLSQMIICIEMLFGLLTNK